MYLFKKKNKSADKNVKTKTEKTASKGVKAQTGKAVSKSTKAQAGKTAARSAKTQPVEKSAQNSGQAQDASDRVLNKLMAIEKETRLKQVRDNVDQLEDEKIAEHLELLLKIMRSEN